MRADRVIGTIDFHTAGIGMRLLTSGLGRLPGNTIADKRRWFQEHLDDLRTGLCLEPRGHRGLLIAVMTEPVTPAAHFGLFFIYPGGYYVSCGEGTIGAATVAVETGLVPRTGTETPVVILGITVPATPSPLNLFMNIPWTADGTLAWAEPVSPPGTYAVFRAEMDLVVAFSACPQDILPINGRTGRTTEAHFTIE